MVRHDEKMNSIGMSSDLEEKKEMTDWQYPLSKKRRERATRIHTTLVFMSRTQVNTRDLLLLFFLSINDSFTYVIRLADIV